MNNPIFWQKRNFLSIIFLPFSWLYIFASKLRDLFIKPIKINKPIICIGNLTVGGAGKTPIAIELGNILKEMAVQFSYLGHGYKAKIKNFTLVNNKEHSSLEVGDEAILLSEIAPTFVAKNRVFAAKQIAKMPDEKLIIMDDGLQNPSLIKDLKILVIDGNYIFGNNLIFPVGPLRRSIKFGSKNCDLVIVIGSKKFKYAKEFQDKKIIFANLKAVNSTKFKDQKFIAFCGIARPEKFFDTLKSNKIKVIEKISFADHHNFFDIEIEKLLKLSKEKSANLITTKKDWVRMDKKYQRQIKYLDVKIEFEKEDKKYIANKLNEIIKNN